MRVELPDGQWAELREELTHGQHKRLQAGDLPRRGESRHGWARRRHRVHRGLRRGLVAPRRGRRRRPTSTPGCHWWTRLPEPVAHAIAEAAAELWRGAGRPKRFNRDLVVFARGGSIATEDDRLADVLWLANSPSWTWRDLEETPEDVLVLLRRLSREQSRVREESAR